MAVSSLQIRKTLYDNRLTLDQYGIPVGTVIDTISAARGMLSAAADSAMNSADEGITTEVVRFHLLSARTYSALQCNTWMPHADKEWHHTCLVCAHARHVLHKNIACCMCMRNFGTDAKNMGSEFARLHYRHQSNKGVIARLVSTQVVVLQNGMEIETLVPSGAYNIAFARTPAEVLAIVYLGSPSTPGGFFPNGVNGNIQG